MSDKDVKILIPVYILKKDPDFKYMKKHDRWWLVSTENQQYICKPKFLKSGCYEIKLKNEENDKMYINQALRFYEIFNLNSREEQIAKKFRYLSKDFYIVYSKEYYFRFDEIKATTGFVDYKAYKKALIENAKLSKKEIRANKKMERLEMKENRRIEKRALEKA